MSVPHPQHQPVSTGTLIGLLSTSFVAWLIIGALAYSDATFVSDDILPFFTAPLSVILVTCLVLVTAEVPSIYYTAAITGFGISAVYSLVSGGWANNHRRIFLAFGGLFGGLLLEAFTGLHTFCTRWLETTLASAQREKRRKDEQVD
ncbi:hypothetical protein ColLi_09820 [Colletotrichum liriopes]|uniref:Uncharacterized protein n=1 Tax=Colletotrichum liriopes TaxID=708192 RepID=A0AA37LWD9_9PEZI|nr:hypothetical protein ColLi_09820 [Colletotrichum liriopes]